MIKRFISGKGYRSKRSGKMRRNRNNNRTIDLYRDSNTYQLNFFDEFGFFPINIHCFLNL